MISPSLAIVKHTVWKQCLKYTFVVIVTSTAHDDIKNFPKHRHPSNNPKGRVPRAMPVGECSGGDMSYNR